MGHRLQEFAWIADRDRAREGVDMLDAAEHLKSPLHAAPHKRLPGCGPECGDLRRFLWDFTYLCWANPCLDEYDVKPKKNWRLGEVKIKLAQSPPSTLRRRPV